MREGELHDCGDNDDISPDEYAKACACLKDVRSIHMGARDYVRQRGLDPEVFLPGNIWADIIDPAAFVNWTYDLVNYARCIVPLARGVLPSSGFVTAPFTGFLTMAWSRQDAGGDLDVHTVNAFYEDLFNGRVGRRDIQARLERDFQLRERMQQSRDWFVPAYDALTKNVPERYRLSTPPRAGEIGIRHRGRILSPDLITYQSLMNALYGAGVLDELERQIASRGSANYLEIGPGQCVFARALRDCLGGRLNVFLVDLPSTMGHGCAYLSCAVGAEAIGLVTEQTRSAIEKPFVFVPSHLLPAYELFLPAMDLAHNATSLNEMNLRQVRYYLPFIKSHLAPEGVFHLSGGQRVLEYHVDALGEASHYFTKHAIYPGPDVRGVPVQDGPNSFFHRRPRAKGLEEARRPAAPRVSVVLFGRNRARTVQRSVESVLDQTYGNFECVVEDGASTDGMVEVVRHNVDPRIDLRSAPEDGAADTFWRALRRCRGEYVCVCLPDEELLPGAVEEGVSALDADPDAVAITRDVNRADAQRGVSRAVLGRPFGLIEYVAGRFEPNLSGAVVRRRAIEAAGLHTRAWDPDCGAFEFWCHLAQIGPIRYLSGAGARRTMAGMANETPADLMRQAERRLRAIDRIGRETTVFDGKPALLRACRVATGLSFAHQLSTIGAVNEAVDLYLAFADESGRLPVPKQPDDRASDYIHIARGQRLIGREASALEVLDAATVLTNIEPSVLHEIGVTHWLAGRVDQALAMYEAATRIAPDFHEAHWQRGVALESRGQIDEALEAWRRSAVTRDRDRHSFYLVTSLKSPQSTSSSLLAAHKEWARHHVARPPQLNGHRFPAWQPGDRATVGYACSFWQADTIRFQLLPILRRHDRRRFKVIAYTHAEPGPLVRSAVDEVRVVGGLSQDDYVRRVRQDGAHILVELNGHSPGHWFAAMGSRCAPVQVSYLNYTSTCGVEEVDYIIGDEMSVPHGAERYFTEEIYRLPGCFFCFTYADALLPPVGSPPSRATGFVTFGCFGSGGKINPRVLDLWAEILRRTPGSRLLVRNGELTPKDNQEALTRALEGRGIERSRLLILPGTTREGVLQSYGQVDVSLDTFPYCGGNTIAESLWQGVPVVSLKGDRFSSAYGASLLTASGLPELVARTPEEYVQKAVALAGEPHRLTFYRKNLRELVTRFGFSDADRFTAALEAAYLDMLARKCVQREGA